MQLSLDQATGLCRMAALGAGANEEAAQSLTASIIAAEAEGLSTVGLTHFMDCKYFASTRGTWEEAWVREP